MALRKATPDDAVACAKILRDWFTTTAFVPRIHTAQEDLGFLKWVIDTQDVHVAEDEQIIGFSAIEGDELNLLYVDEANRGQRVGRQLLDGAMKDKDKLWLWCFQANAGARKFYERAGFQAMKFTEGDGNEEKTPDVRYEWSKS